MNSNSAKTRKLSSRPAESIVTSEGDISASTETISSLRPERAGESSAQNAKTNHRGVLIVNADDWGRDLETTDRISDCAIRGTVSSVSAMVFMEDSERAAAIARKRNIDAGLHLNFTTSFSAPGIPPRLIEHQQRITRYLRWHRLAQVLYHPGLASSFKYIVAAQLDEFRRLYGKGPERIDGHHHMHLCANVLIQKLLPSGTVVRRNFSFQASEKNFVNRLYRQFVDRLLARRHVLTDYFFSLPPLEPSSHLERIFALAGQFVIEAETHPVNPDEYRFLAGGEIFKYVGDNGIASCFAVPRPVHARNHTNGLVHL